jgi:uncharacterized membrane protein YjjP (DUF1212 family)
MSSSPQPVVLPPGGIERRADYYPPDSVNFILSLGRALHSFGYEAHRLEEVLGLAASHLGIEAQFFSTPTSIFAAFGRLDKQRTFLIRVEPGDVELGKLALIDRVVTSVLHGEVTPSAGSERIAEIAAGRPRYGKVLTTLAACVASGAAARFLGGGLTEILVAAGLGFVIGLLALVAARYAAMARVFQPTAAFSAALLVYVAGALIGPFGVFTATLAGIIVLVPGLTLTIAMTELSTRNLVSGTARLSGAFMVFIGIAFGVALGNNIGGQIFGAAIPSDPVALPAWTNIVALLTAPVAFGILFQAHPDDGPWIVLTGVLAFYGSRLGAVAFGPELGVFVGALTVGVTSNVLARLRDRPTTITLVPGLLILVPGSIGYRSLSSLLDREVVLGIETAFRMILIAMALVAGLLASNVVTPPRRL